MKPGELTQQQELFTLNWFKTGHKTNSAIAAGYSVSRAASTGSRLATYGKILARRDELRAEVKSALIMGEIERRERLSEIARARLVEFVCAGPDGDQINVGPESPNNAALAEITSVTKYSKDAEGNDQPAVITKLKLHNPVAAIQELNRMDGTYPTEKHEVTLRVERYEVILHGRIGDGE